MYKIFKDSISRETYERALNNSWNVNISESDMFPENILDWISKQALQLGVPSSSISYPLITATALTLGESYVEVKDSYIESIIIYSLVAGRSGTNKSGSLSVITKLVKHLPTEPNKTNLFDTGKY